MHATNYDIGCDRSQSYYRNSSPSSRSSSSSILSVAFRALQAIAQFFCSIPSKISNFFFPVQPGRYSQGYHYNSAAPSAPPLPEMQAYRNSNGEMEMLPVATSYRAPAIYVNDARPYYED